MSNIFLKILRKYPGITINKQWAFSVLGLATVMVFWGCSSEKSPQKNETTKSVNEMEKGTFGYDVAFLQNHTDVVVLKSKDSEGQVLVTPRMQGRVMTSTVEGDSGKSLGWVNHELIASGEIKEHFTPYGGEDRFWLGPEGGQYSVFIKPGEEMVFENWYVPPGFNTEPWDLSNKSENEVRVEKELNLVNYSKNEFSLNVERTIKLLDESQIENLLDIQISEEIKHVAFETKNSITNTGEEAWTKETGTVSIWILSMFTPAPGITVVIPYKQGSDEQLGSIVTTEYFGEVGPEWLKTEEGVIYFKVDGKKRGKLGVSPLRAKKVAGSYDATNNILTVIQYTFPENNADYVNQLWKQQSEPYKGNMVFAYNDGPLEDGSQLGPFYELESSSPAAFLKPDETLTHDHRVFHFTGNENSLDQISRALFGVTLEQIKSAF